MTVLKRSLLFAVLLSFFTFSCAYDFSTDDESFCEVEGDIKCLKTINKDADHRICTDGKWVESKCGASSVCQDNACVKICEKTKTFCLNASTVEICIASEVAKTKPCDLGLICDAVACANGEECCVEGKICTETHHQCLDLRTAETCVKDAQVDVEICGEGFYCDSESCAAGLDCCVRGKICDTTQNICLNDDTLELCVADQRPSEQMCGKGFQCILGECVSASCLNGRLDVGEKAVDCGGACAPCVDCRSDIDCGDNGFCDSASGYVCSKRCRTDADCANSDLWDGDYCRGDGRCSPKVFETVWVLTDKDRSVVLPFDGTYTGAACDFQILWGDEAEGTDITALSHVTACKDVENRTHKYSKAGEYKIKIIGTYDGWGAFDDINIDKKVDAYELTSAATKLRSVLSFGPVGLSAGAFYGATELYLVPTKDIPDASKLNNLDKTFWQASKFNASVGHWDTSRVTSMYAMFHQAQRFNRSLTAWNTSLVTRMSSMFNGAWLFNQPIGGWDTSLVTDMRYMFYDAKVFNQFIGKWNTSRVTTMAYMFQHAQKFNQSLDEWDTSKVTDMTNMFVSASAFDQSLTEWKLSFNVTLGNMFFHRV